MNQARVPLSIALVALAAAGLAQSKIGVLSSGAPTIDAKVVAVLSADGNEVTLLPRHDQTPIGFNFFAYDSIYLQPNVFFSSVIPDLVQVDLKNYVRGGGGLVTAEWAIWGSGSGYNASMSGDWFGTYAGSYSSNPSLSASTVTSDPVIHAGLPASFTIPLDSVGGGTYTNVTAKSEAQVFYGFQDGGVTRPVAFGGQRTLGRIFHYATVNGVAQFNDPNFARLFQNSFRWVKGKSVDGPGIRGRYTLLALADQTQMRLRVTYQNVSNNLIVGTADAVVDADGFFTALGPSTPGTYRVLLKARTGLTRRPVGTYTTQVGQEANVGEVVSHNGDIDGDDEITVFDYIQLSFAFDTVPGDGAWDPDADLDGDGAVTVFDYITLSNGFGEAGM